MCGRFARYAPLIEWVDALGTGVDPNLIEGLGERDAGPRYNIAPGTPCWIAAFDAAGELALDELKWTFPTSRGNRINVRSETAHRVPEYKEPYDKHRCVVLANGFYEPKGEKTAKNRPWYFFRAKDQSPLFLGAIAKADGFSILTRTPVPPVSEIHDRTPVFVPVENVLAWLDPEIPGRDALQRFAPVEYGERLDVWLVGDAAKRVTSEGPALIERFDPESGDLI